MPIPGMTEHRMTGRFRKRKPRARALAAERLEPRCLLAGLTILTHGFNGNVDGWLTAMADAIALRPDLAIDQPRYRVDVTDPGHDGGPLSVVNTSRSGPAPTDDATLDPEIVVLLNWTDVAGTVAIGGGYHRDTFDIAAEVAAKLVTPGFLVDLATPLAELPIHLLGHSRGASLVGELAHQLGLLGVWVEEVTTWDPHPVDGIREPSLFNLNFGDAPMVSWENVAFWDNYWRTEGNNSFDFTGEPVTGSADLQLSESVLTNGGYSNEHSDVHLWYHGTVDLSENPPASDGDADVPNTWYGGAHPARDASGFYYSRMVGGTRPAAGVPVQLGGTASRTAVNWSAATWPNLLQLELTSPDPQFVVGETVPVSYYHQDADSGATVTFFFDIDRNPYNDNAFAAGQQSVGQTSALNQSAAELSTESIPEGDYFVSAQITDGGGRRRFAYVPQPITLGSFAEADDFASGEATVTGTVIQGSYLDSRISDDVHQQIQEATSGGKPSNRRTRLEHRWSIDVTGGASVTFFAEAHHSSTEEAFRFEYFDGTGWQAMFEISGEQNLLRSFSLPGSVSGLLDVRLVDLGDAPGESNRDSVFVDQLFVRSSSGPAPPSFAITDVSVTEGDSGTILATFTVTRSGDSSVAASVVYATVDGTALANIDYDAIAATQLDFGPDVLSRQIDVIVNGDTDIEGDETFFVQLSNPSAGATISDDQGTGLIQNDDASPGVELTGISPNTITAGAVNLPVTISGSGIAAGATVAFANGSGPSPVTTNVMVISANTLTANISVTAGGKRGCRLWDVIVTNPDSSSDTLVAAFGVEKDATCNPVTALTGATLLVVSPVTTQRTGNPKQPAIEAIDSRQPVAGPPMDHPAVTAAAAKLVDPRGSNRTHVEQDSSDLTDAVDEFFALL